MGHCVSNCFAAMENISTMGRRPSGAIAGVEYKTMNESNESNEDALLARVDPLIRAGDVESILRELQDCGECGQRATAREA